MYFGALAGSLGSFPFDDETYLPPSHSRTVLTGIRSLIGFGILADPSPVSALPPAAIIRGCTSMHFGENQLFPGLISLSLRPTAHPLTFQRQWVRPSRKFYQPFSLAMGSSPGFGSAHRDSSPCSDSVSLRLHLAA
jgi:hypothetical protein